MKTCTMCNNTKSEELFYLYLDKRTGNHYRSSRCKACMQKIKRVQERREGSYAYYYSKMWRVHNRARLRGIAFELTTPDYKKIISEERCYYCEEVPILKTVDRKNNNLGYTRDNCVMACFSCNKLKGNLTAKDKARLMKIVAVL